MTVRLKTGDLGPARLVGVVWGALRRGGYGVTVGFGFFEIEIRRG